MLQILMGGQIVVDSVHNVFEEIALQVFPGLDQIYRLVAGVSGSRPHLSGAGPALFCVLRGEEEGRRMADTLRSAGLRAYLVHAIMPQPAAPS
jgi:4-diphosphocytidyl-2C-methyl-D-erythritol kinase